MFLENTELFLPFIMNVYPEHKTGVDFQIKNKTLKHVNPHPIKVLKVFYQVPHLTYIPTRTVILYVFSKERC